MTNARKLAKTANFVDNSIQLTIPGGGTNQITTGNATEVLHSDGTGGTYWAPGGGGGGAWTLLGFVSATGSSEFIVNLPSPPPTTLAIYFNRVYAAPTGTSSVPTIELGNFDGTTYTWPGNYWNGSRLSVDATSTVDVAGYYSTNTLDLIDGSIAIAQYGMDSCVLLTNKDFFGRGSWSVQSVGLYGEGGMGFYKAGGAFDTNEYYFNAIRFTAFPGPFDGGYIAIYGLAD